MLFGLAVLLGAALLMKMIGAFDFEPGDFDAPPPTYCPFAGI